MLVPKAADKAKVESPFVDQADQQISDRNLKVAVEQPEKPSEQRAY